MHYFALHLMLNPHYDMHCNLRLAHPTEAVAQAVSQLLTALGLIPGPCSALSLSKIVSPKIAPEAASSVLECV